jgi:sugar lactone lactonase YvrE
MKQSAKFFTDGFIFPESPRWHKGSFYCCSIDEGKIFRIGEEGSKNLIVESDDAISGWSFCGSNSDEIVLTSAREKKLLKWSDGVLRQFADLNNIPCTLINDLICTENGDIFVGTIRLPAGVTSLLEAIENPLAYVDPAGDASIADEHVGFANGMVITPNGETLIVADSMKSCLHAYTLGSDGALSDHRIFADIPNSTPDGICLDGENGVWVTTHNHVYRVVEGGQITDEIDMGSTDATACMLGGEELRTLLITASDSHDRSVILDNPSGRLFTAQVKVAGAGLPSFY